MKRALFILLLLDSACLAQEVRRAEPVYTMTQAEYDATLKHRNDLAEKRNGELQSALTETQKAAAVIPDLNKQIKVQDAEISHWKSKDFWDSWKFSFIGLVVGLGIAIITAYLAKMGLLGATATASIAKLAAKV